MPLPILAGALEPYIHKGDRHDATRPLKVAPSAALSVGYCTNLDHSFRFPAMLLSSTFALGAPLVPPRDCDLHPAILGDLSASARSGLWRCLLT